MAGKRRSVNVVTFHVWKMFRKAIACLVLVITVSILYVLWSQTSVVNNCRVTDFGDSRPLPRVSDSCPEYFLQSHFMTIDDTTGRIGNNLFRLLALIGTARKYCYTPLLDKKIHNLLNDTFDLSFISEIPKQDFRWHIMQTVSCCRYPIEMDSLNTSFNWTFKGYLQSWRYMHGEDEYIRSVINFRSDIMRNASDYILGLKEYNDFGKNEIIVCTHIRRGGFIGATNLRYITSNVSYIEKAMAYYHNKFSQNKVIYVMISYDISWVKANIKGSNVYYSDGRSATVDMAILTLCDHSIITTGTFGYLGAWLSGGSVVYDSTFPKTGSPLAVEFNPADYYPNTWVAL